MTERRATADADANWRSTVEELERTLDRSAALDLGDRLSFEIGSARPLQGEGEEGALPFPIVVVLAGREFERINLDVNLVPTDQRPIEEIRLRDLLGFADIPGPNRSGNSGGSATRREVPRLRSLLRQRLKPTA